MNSSTLRGLLLLSALAVTFCTGADCVQGQLFSALKTGRFEPAFKYAPADPWTRSKAIQVQTKHYGLFYNCDSEECKRNSPYIRWTDHCEKDLPSKVKCTDRIACELNRIRQRIFDGAGACLDGNCTVCPSCRDCDQCESCQPCKTSRCEGQACSSCQSCQGHQSTQPVAPAVDYHAMPISVDDDSESNWSSQASYTKVTAAVKKAPASPEKNLLSRVRAKVNDGAAKATTEPIARSKSLASATTATTKKTRTLRSTTTKPFGNPRLADRLEELRR